MPIPHLKVYGIHFHISFLKLAEHIILILHNYLGLLAYPPIMPDSEWANESAVCPPLADSRGMIRKARASRAKIQPLPSGVAAFFTK